MSKNNEALASILNSARDGKIEEVNDYIAKRKNLNAQGPDGRTLLINAAANHHASIVNLLLNAGADVKVATNSGKTVLNYALCSVFGYDIGGKKCDSSALETVKLLLARQCAVSYFDVASAILFQKPEVLNFLLKKVSQNKKLLSEAAAYATKNAYEYNIDEGNFEKNLALVRARLNSSR